MLGDEGSSAGVVAELKAALSHAPAALDRLSLLFGDVLARSAPLVEVITCWSGSDRADDVPRLTRTLGRAVGRDAAIARGDLMDVIQGGQGQPVGTDTGSIGVAVSGASIRVPNPRLPGVPGVVF
jgi:hypothetical protein